MKIISNVVKILLVVLLLYVLIQNADQKVNLTFFTFFYPHVHFSLIMLIALGFGAVLGAILMGFSIIQLRTEIRGLNRKNKQLRQELENLRNISVDEIPDEDFSEPEKTKS